MPPSEARKFKALVAGGGSVSLPLDGLPPITLPRDPPQPSARPECGWYYGERCGCGDRSNHGHQFVRPKQLPLL